MNLARNEGKRMVAFMRRNLFSCFGVLRTIISDRDLNFCKKMFWAILEKVLVKQHMIDLPYHP